MNIQALYFENLKRKIGINMAIPKKKWPSYETSGANLLNDNSDLFLPASLKK